MAKKIRKFLVSFSPGRRVPRLVLGAVSVGVIVGLIVSGFESLVENVLLDELFKMPLWVMAGAPVVAIMLSGLILRSIGGKDATPSTSDEYVKAYHDRTPKLPLRHLPAKFAAGAASIGLGGSLGLEGPAIYVGSSVGLNGPTQIAKKWFNRDEAKILLTAGAAAGVSAIFRAPATGVMFALESPYLNDLGRRALLPSLFSSAMSFIIFAGIHGSDPVFPVLGSDPHALAVADIIGGAIIGVAAGVGARAFSWLTGIAKKIYKTVKPFLRIASCGAILVGLVLATYFIYDAPLSLGPGGEAVHWLLEDDVAASDTGNTASQHAVNLERSLWLIALLFAFRATATLTTVAGGGTGGLFIPLAVQGIILGGFIGELINEAQSSLYPTLGLAAFLGAGYRTPIAAVMFVAESSGASPFVVPALVAAAVSQLMVGRSTVSQNQAGERQGHLERRLTLPVSSALNTEVMTVPPDAHLSEFVYFHVLSRRERNVPVVDGGKYIGMCTLEEVEKYPRDTWETTQVSEALSPDYPTAELTATLRDVVHTMDERGVGMLCVVDPQGDFVGIVTNDEIVKLDEILEETGS